MNVSKDDSGASWKELKEFSLKYDFEIEHCREDTCTKMNVRISGTPIPFLTSQNYLGPFEGLASQQIVYTVQQ